MNKKKIQDIIENILKLLSLETEQFEVTFEKEDQIKVNIITA